MIILDNCRIPTAVLAPEDARRFQARDSLLEPSALLRIRIDKGFIIAIEDAKDPVGPAPDATVQRFDLAGQLLLPRFLDAHIHLDKAHTWDRSPNRSGTFGEALRVLGEDRLQWSEEDVWQRANRALESAWRHGTVAVRTHIDTGLPWAERSHRAIAALREQWKGRVEIQSVSLCSVDQYAGSDGRELADLPLRYGAIALGGMPLMNPALDLQLDALLQLARERSVGIDLHVDESGDPQARTLLAVANAVLRNRFDLPVTCGHCCSLAVLPNDLQRQTLQRCKDAGIRVISLPLCNLYLQDRFSTEAPKTSANRTPFWRGITLLKEWMDQGTITACASDNVRDAFYAYGDMDAFEVLIQSVRIGHLDDLLARTPSVVTTAPASIMGIDKDYGRIAVGRPARTICFEETSFSTWLSRPTQQRRLFERDRWLE